MSTVIFRSKSDNPYTFNTNVTKNEENTRFARFEFNLWSECAKIFMETGAQQQYETKPTSRTTMDITAAHQTVAQLKHSMWWRRECSVKVEDVDYLIKRTSLILGHTIYRVEDGGRLCEVGSFSRIGLYSWRFKTCFKQELSDVASVTLVFSTLLTSRHNYFFGEVVGSIIVVLSVATYWSIRLADLI